MSRSFSSLLIVISFIVIWLVNFYYPYASLWILLLIPGVSSLILFPKWKIALWLGFIITIIMIVTEFWIYAQGHILFIEIQRFFVTLSVWWMVYLYAAYLSIQNKKLFNELEKLALTDPLTNTFNRRYLDIYMKKTIPLYKRREDSLTVILFDIDHFKRINDKYGHNKGDIILERVARVSSRVIRESDVLIRIGGEEFLIVLPDTTVKDAFEIANRINKIVGKETFLFEGIYVTLSLGISSYKVNQSLEELIGKADQALYRAKKNGRNQIMVADD